MSEPSVHGGSRRSPSGGAVVRLEPMTEPEYARFLADLLPSYAAEHRRSGRWDERSALANARLEAERLLPQGRETPGHRFFTILDDSSGTPVGQLWLGRLPPPEMPAAFVFYITIDPPQRRHGYAAAALRAAEEWAKAEGLEQIALHVFGWNTGAIELYRTLGYETVGLQMRKRLGPADR